MTTNNYNVLDTVPYVRLAPAVNATHGIVLEHTTPGVVTDRPLSVKVDTGHADGLRDRFVIENNPAGAQLIDVNFRGASVNIGNPDPAVSADCILEMYSKVGASGQALRIWRPGSSTVAASYFGRNGDLVLNVGGIASTALTVGTNGDANSKFRISETGGLLWGAGGGTALDTSLYRSGADILKTDDKLVAAAGLGVGNAVAATLPGLVIKKIEVFDANGSSLGFVAVYDAIT